MAIAVVEVAAVVGMVDDATGVAIKIPLNIIGTVVI